MNITILIGILIPVIGIILILYLLIPKNKHITPINEYNSRYSLKDYEKDLIDICDVNKVKLIDYNEVIVDRIDEMCGEERKTEEEEMQHQDSKTANPTYSPLSPHITNNNIEKTND